jgi:ferredoxin
MNQLVDKVKELLENGSISIMVGYKKGFNSDPIPAFAENSKQAELLIYNAQCLANLAVYMHKSEIKKHKKVGILANISTLKSILQLVSENQLWELEKTVLTVTKDEQILVFTDVKEIEKYVQENYPEFSEEDLAQIAKLEAMTREERWEFWTEQFSACIKCYACRAVCPMCYCSKCTVECNQPQWITVSSETVGNLEWHSMRAMHLAGRCINCGECGRQCPAGIPIHLLTAKLNMDIEKEFGSKTGFCAESEYAMNTFNPNDKEGFIR